jgi:AbrB family looped-hinge helix DNA binding protein
MIKDLDIQKFTSQVRQRGQITIPQKLRESLAINEGDVLTFLQVGDNILLTPHSLRTFELADKISEMMEEEGVTLADLLKDLPQIRAEIYQERFGSKS